MKVVNILAADSSQALRKVSEEFGPDASILACRRVEDGVELVVALEESAAQPRPARSEQPNLSTAFAQPEALRDFKRELAHSRQLLERGMKSQGWAIEGARNPSKRGALQICQALDIAPDIATALCRAISPDESIEVQRDLLRSLLRRQIRTLPPPTAGITALVGPTGAGKTSTIAKIAASYVKAGRADDIALVTLDTLRIGAQEQLRVYGDIFRLPVHNAGNTDEAARLFDLLSDKALILLDTTGVGFRDKQGLESLSSLFASLPDMDVLLALPADREHHVMEEIVGAYAELPLLGLVPTHLDEAVRMGGLLSTMIRHRLPVVWYCDGSAVPGHLRVADSTALVTKAFGMAREFKSKQRSAAQCTQQQQSTHGARGQLA